MDASSAADHPLSSLKSGDQGIGLRARTSGLRDTSILIQSIVREEAAVVCIAHTI